MFSSHCCVVVLMGVCHVALALLTPLLPATPPSTGSGFVPLETTVLLGEDLCEPLVSITPTRLVCVAAPSQPSVRNVTVVVRKSPAPWLGGSPQQVEYSDEPTLVVVFIRTTAAPFTQAACDYGTGYIQEVSGARPNSTACTLLPSPKPIYGRASTWHSLAIAVDLPSRNKSQALVDHLAGPDRQDALAAPLTIDLIAGVWVLGLCGRCVGLHAVMWS